MTILRAIALLATLLAMGGTAEAQHHHRHHHYSHHSRNYVAHHHRQARNYIAQGAEHVVGGRPSGCPHAFCGCEAALYVFHRIIPDLNLAANWIHRYQRAAPAPGMAAARSGHVMILMSHVGGSIWHVHDGNSGHHLTREHDRSIAGYVVVDPGRPRYASR
jgi:hypothetical protein